MKKFITKIIIVSIAAILVLTTGFIFYTHSRPAAESSKYPAFWANYPRDTLTDSWHMGNRECTSYVAWKIFTTYSYSVYDWGNAKDWPAMASSRGFVIQEKPEVHGIAVRKSGPQGHVMWIEKLNDDGTMHVSQYNIDEKGNYSEADVKPGGYVFISFTAPHQPVPIQHKIKT